MEMTLRDWLQFGEVAAASLAFIVALFALRLGRESFRRDHKPILRPVLLWTHGQATTDVKRNWIAVKNLGRGPAIAITVFSEASNVIIGGRDALEPLGAGERESKRVGRAVVALLPGFEDQVKYVLYCQDILGEWHATDFVRNNPFAFTCRFRGKISRRNVPLSVREAAHVVPRAQLWNKQLDDHDRVKEQMRRDD